MDGWQVPMNLTDDVVFHQPTTIEERAEVAEACVLRLNLKLPTLLDNLRNEVDEAYSALPERIFLIDSEGKIAWRCDMGPFGFDPDGLEKAIQSIGS